MIAAEPATGAHAENPWEGRKSEWNPQGSDICTQAMVSSRRPLH